MVRARAMVQKRWYERDGASELWREESKAHASERTATAPREIAAKTKARGSKQRLRFHSSTTCDARDKGSKVSRGNVNVYGRKD